MSLFVQYKYEEKGGCMENVCILLLILNLQRKISMIVPMFSP